MNFHLAKLRFLKGQSFTQFKVKVVAFTLFHFGQPPMCECCNLIRKLCNMYAIKDI